MKILLTGGTGYLGNHLTGDLLAKADMVYLLARSKHHKRLQKKYADVPNVKVVIGDISNPDVIDDDRDLEEVTREVDCILHAAAYYDIEGSYPSCFMYNVVGTQNVLYLASLCKNLKEFHYISTIAVAGNFEGVFLEDGLQHGQKFTNHYARTKFEAELMVRDWQMPDVKKRIYRLGILVGESESGEMTKTDGPYYFFKLLGQLTRHQIVHTIRFMPLPFDNRSVFPIVPVDHAARLIIQSLFNNPSDKNLRTYHVIGNACPTAGEFVKDTLKAYGLRARAFPLPSNRLNGLLMKRLGMPEELLEYMYAAHTFDCRSVESDFPALKKCSYNEYKDKMFKYAREHF